MNEADYDLIEQYLEGTLKNEDLISFENRLKTDSQLAEELALRQDMEHFLSIKTEKDALKKELPKISQSFFHESKNEQKEEAKVIQLTPFYKKKSFILGSVAAAVLLFFMIQFLRPTDSLYEQYREEYQLALAEKGGSEVNLSKLDKEFTAGNYAYAKEQLELYLDQNSADTRAQIAYAISLMELDETTQAQQILSTIYKDSNKILFKNAATWYLAMSYLKEENFTETKKYLVQIQEGKYSEKAKKLLNKLK